MNLRNNGRPRKKYVDDGSDEELDFMMPSIKKKRRDVLPKSPQNAPAPQPIKKAKRMVQFVEQGPIIHEITPLHEKPIGVIRMPEASKSLQEDMESPPILEELRKENVVDVEEESRQSVEYIDSVVGSVTRHSSKMGMDEEDKEEIKSLFDVHNENNYQPIEDDVTIVLKNVQSKDEKIQPKEKPQLITPSVPKNHLLSDEDKYAYERGFIYRPLVNKQLWCELFQPHTKDDFFCKSKQDFQQLTDWLQQWGQRLGWMQREENKKLEKNNKRRRRRNAFLEDDGTEDGGDEDEDFNPVGERLNNPIVLEGPIGCGKTSMVYAAAEEANFEVLEIAASGQRDGATLKHKLAGALQSHNVGNDGRVGHQDIRAMFSPSASNIGRDKKRKKGKYSLILIDECDLIFKSDDKFWPSLKNICTESRIPIVLTCNDYELVGGELDTEPALDNYTTIHMERPNSQQFLQYLRFWLYGLTSKYTNTDIIYDIIERRGDDARAILNTLQSGEFKEAVAMLKHMKIQKKPHYPKDGSDDRIATSFKEQGKRAKRLAELDATMGQTDERISLLAKQWTNLDFTGGAFTWMATQWDLAEKLEGRRELRAEIFDATQMDSEYEAIANGQKELENALRLACHCSQERLYSLRETSLDMLPCLLAIHESHLLNKHNNSSSPFRQSRRAPLHPFDIVDQELGTMIDQNGRGFLKLAIGEFKIEKQQS